MAVLNQRCRTFLTMSRMRFVRNIQVNSEICIHNYPQTVKEFLDTGFWLLVEDPDWTGILDAGFWVLDAGHGMHDSNSRETLCRTFFRAAFFARASQT